MGHWFTFIFFLKRVRISTERLLKQLRPTHVTARELPMGSSWNFVLGSFTKICIHITVLSILEFWFCILRAEDIDTIFLQNVRIYVRPASASSMPWEPYFTFQFWFKLDGNNGCFTWRPRRVSAGRNDLGGGDSARCTDCHG